MYVFPHFIMQSNIALASDNDRGQHEGGVPHH
jgi:hypothetical protein